MRWIDLKNGWDPGLEPACVRETGSMPFEVRIEEDELVVAWPSIQDHPEGCGETARRIPISVISKLFESEFDRVRSEPVRRKLAEEIAAETAKRGGG